MRRSLPLLSFLVSCATDGKPAVSTDSTTAPVEDSGAALLPPGCGDGVVDAGEQCDDGPANSDVDPNRCRTDCALPRCGDGVVDDGESCDDGNTAGADGCAFDCTQEVAAGEVEPNDSWDAAQALSLPANVVGVLPEGDQDCFVVDVPACSALAATVDGDCGGPLVLSLHDSAGQMVASGGASADHCAQIDPSAADGARFLDAGDYSVCVSAPLDDPSLGYTLDLRALPPEETDFGLSDDEDPDGDGIPDRCDDDDDGDGVLDDEDDCPTVPDGAGAPPLSVSADGFVRTWLGAGPFTGTTSTDRCRASDDALVDATDDALAVPVLAGAAGTKVWTVLWSTSDRIEFLTDYGGVGAPREVYTAVWFRGDPGTAVLAIGPDDGARAWVDGEVVLDVASCQGTNVDQFRADVTLTGDWQLLLLKVRDQGGGWGTFVRFLDAAGQPITDLELALTADGSPLPAVDTDRDGQGDACDDTPAG